MIEIRVGDCVEITGGEMTGSEGIVLEIRDDESFDGGKEYLVDLREWGPCGYCLDWIKFKWGFRGEWKMQRDSNPHEDYDRAMKGII